MCRFCRESLRHLVDGTSVKLPELFLWVLHSNCPGLPASPSSAEHPADLVFMDFTATANCAAQGSETGASIRTKLEMPCGHRPLEGQVALKDKTCHFRCCRTTELPIPLPKHCRSGLCHWGYGVPFHTDIRTVNLAWLVRVVRA